MTRESFIIEFLSETDPNPFANCEQVWRNRAAFEIQTSFDGGIRLSCIRSFERGKGDGSAALNWLCALADKHAVTLSGDIEPVGQTRPRLSRTQLKQWYRRHGFVATASGAIRREPLNTEIQTKTPTLTLHIKSSSDA